MIKERPDFPVLLLGNKADLDPQDRRVTLEQGQELAKSWGCGFYETSAKTRQNIEESFDYLVRAMVKHASLLKSGGGDSGGLMGAGKKKGSTAGIDPKKEKKDKRPEKVSRSYSEVTPRKKKSGKKCVVM